ncbi:Mov34/MPN/PAD-1 family protein [Lysobacter sp. TAF61]|uniref:Mov34/MPN/PAD-1 family protein n=1 Tax=Lysobacter sp. TAF61 TaxID=3233072 RepID=UPI003F9C99EF
MKLLEMSAIHWRSLILELRLRGKGRRESGAFLLGTANGSNGPRRVSAWLNYEQLDPHCAEHDYIRIRTEAFPLLWDYCQARELEVLADVHTHPWGPRQSASDKHHPMVSVCGHVALIVPNFAQGDIHPGDVSVNIYQGGGNWISHYGAEAAAAIHLT